MLFRKVYGVDLGTSTIKVYSYQKDKVYQERNMHVPLLVDLIFLVGIDFDGTGAQIHPINFPK